MGGGGRRGVGAVTSSWLALTLALQGPLGAGSQIGTVADGPERWALQEIVAEEGEPFEGEGARIGTVTIARGDVFDLTDPAQNKRLYRWVNALHPATREKVIRRQLLFRTGDPYDPRLLEESERILRRNRFLYDAEIRPIGMSEDKVDVEVWTRDVWTLSGGASFSRSGGENRANIGVQDFNLFGTGKELSIDHKSDEARSSTEVVYEDPNLFGTRGELELKMADYSDGHRNVLHLQRPFFALDTRWAAGLTVVQHDAVDRFYDAGRVTGEFRHQVDQYEGWFGVSPGLVEGGVRRWRFGYTYLRDAFGEAAGRIRPKLVPPGRTLSYPWVDFELTDDRFVEARDLDKLNRTEDLRLGRRLQARLGVASRSLGSDRDVALFAMSGDLALRPHPRRLLLTNANLGSRVASDGVETLVINGQSKLFWRNWGQHLLYVELGGSWADNLDAESQLQLGGDAGLRGYPLRYQTGDRRVLLTVEQRFFTRWEPLKLANVGAAVFFDMGSAWFGGGEAGEGFDLLKDVGFGLRLSPSRSGRGTLIHFDVAFPLDGNGDIDRIQWLVTTKETF